MSEMNHNELPHPARDELDATMDTNLHALGARTGPVPAPSAAQVQAWRSNAATAAPSLKLTDAAPAHSTHPPHSHPMRRSRWLAAGSAIAACVAVAAAIFIQPWGSQVQAS